MKAFPRVHNQHDRRDARWLGVSADQRGSCFHHTRPSQWALRPVPGLVRDCFQSPCCTRPVEFANLIFTDCWDSLIICISSASIYYERRTSALDCKGLICLLARQLTRILFSCVQRHRIPDLLCPPRSRKSTPEKDSSVLSECVCVCVFCVTRRAATEPREVASLR